MSYRINYLGRVAGFTLIELVVAVTILAILLTTGIPSMTEFVTANRVTAQADKFTRDLNYARSEAVKSGLSVFICRSANQTSCGNGTNWEQGWIIFRDADSDNTLDAGEEIRTSDGLTNAYTLRQGGNFANWIAYQPSGVSIGSGGNPNDTFRVCRPDADTNKARSIDVNAMGRVQVSIGATACP